ncbi:MAG: B12-binding domain-containing radical SAM protein [Elusimicrobia bacterium]|nr:B12-binding domain-containing radical SAM protein [Elusimicrobiota bacterium]
MRITLIEPPRYYSPTSPISTVVIPPLGLAYIAGTLEAAGHELTVVDALSQGMDRFAPYRSVYLRGLPVSEICDQVPADTQLIGVTCMFSAQWLIVRELLSELKRRFPKVPLVLGGEHGTGMPELSMEQAPIDYIVTGEGEETIVELAGRLERGLPAEGLKGTVTRSSAGATVNPRRDRIKGIDDIPLPAWHLFKVDEYITFNQPHGASRGRFMPMLATRGCPFKCTFCTSPQMWTQTWLPRNPALVVDEMERYIERYKATDFHFEDLTAIVRKDWIIGFCDTITKRGLKITFQLPSGTRSEAVDDQTAAAMKSAGCHEFSFAPESGDERVLKAIKKQVKLPALFKSAKSAMDAGINVGGFFIVGFPEDTYGSILNTYWAIARCAIHGFASVNVNPYSPQPNTASFRDLKGSGKIGEIDDDYFLNLFRFQDLGATKFSYNDRFTARDIRLLVLVGFGVFYFFYFATRPWRILTLLRDVVTGKSSNKSARAFTNLVKDLRSFGHKRAG